MNLHLELYPALFRHLGRKRFIAEQGKPPTEDQLKRVLDTAAEEVLSAAYPQPPAQSGTR